MTTIQLEEVVKSEEKALLVAVKYPSTSDFDLEESLAELEQLTLTAGATVTARVVQEREAPHLRTFIGPGKAKEIADVTQEADISLVIFDNDLSPSQQRNLEEIISAPIKIVDRTALILDIFAQRAHSKEGKLQVELAQANYRLPRLRGRGIELSKLGGGIGTRGPGETKLEVDLRRIRKRVTHLKKELAHITQNRQIQRKKRRKENVFSLALVGYTNAGKSTLLNALTDSDVFTYNKLFATLDSTTRRLTLPNRQTVTISDTVGFIKKLPHQLIAAFRSTLDEVREADLLLHVIDISHPQVEDHIKAVETVLSEIGASELPRLEVFNKIDKLKPLEVAGLKIRFSQGAFVSALTKTGLDKLLARMEEASFDNLVKVELEIPFDEGKLIDEIYQLGEVIAKRYTSQGVNLTAKIEKEHLYRVKRYLVKQKFSLNQRTKKTN